MDNMCSLAIVRNPYSRMVSIYGYNRFGERESFPVFLKRWKKLMRHYTEKGEKEEWMTPCHCLPMFEYTHHEGKLRVAFCICKLLLQLYASNNVSSLAKKNINNIGIGRKTDCAICC